MTLKASHNMSSHWQIVTGNSNLKRQIRFARAFLCFFLLREQKKEERPAQAKKEERLAQAKKEENLAQAKKKKSPCLLVFLIFKKKKDKM
jgi:hypothetical protein